GGGERSLASAFASICRARSRVTERWPPISSSVGVRRRVDPEAQAGGDRVPADRARRTPGERRETSPRVQTAVTRSTALSSLTVSQRVRSSSSPAGVSASTRRSATAGARPAATGEHGFVRCSALLVERQATERWDARKAVALQSGGGAVV